MVNSNFALWGLLEFIFLFFLEFIFLNIFHLLLVELTYQSLKIWRAYCKLSFYYFCYVFNLLISNY